MKQFILKFTNLPAENEGDIFTIKEFIEMAQSGGINDGDGTGKWATETQESNCYVDFGSPSLGYPEEFRATHVCWYNK